MTSRNFPSTLTEAYMIENKNKDRQKEEKNPPKTTEKETQGQQPWLVEVKKNSHQRKRRKQQKKPLARDCTGLPKTTTRKIVPFCGRIQNSGETPAAGKLAGDQNSRPQPNQW
uniref:Uncharacterized protein n=1 Tax=Opuntia streptacantha TaxID=393608 RepID=A0A7C9DJH7_OPUST